MLHFKSVSPRKRDKEKEEEAGGRGRLSTRRDNETEGQKKKSKHRVSGRLKKSSQPANGGLFLITIFWIWNNIYTFTSNNCLYYNYSKV